MSHPSEASLVTYADDQLAGQALHDLEEHLVQCRDCRSSVVALREEARLFTDAMLERVRPAREPVRLPAPEPDMAMSVPFAVAAVTGALAVLGILVESRLPGGLDILHPLRLKGVSEMAFDLFFFLRDRAPGLVELALSVGILATISGLLTFGVGLVYRRVFGSAIAIGLALAMTGVAPERASAIVFTSDQDTHVAPGETVDEGMFLSGGRVRIDGTVAGDVVVMAELVRVSGRIEGNLYALTRDLEISGSVDGGVHAVAARAWVDGDVKGSAFIMAERLTLATGASIEGDLWTGSEHAILDGHAKRDVVFWGEELEASGAIERNLEARWTDELILRDSARIGGDVDAWLAEDTEVARADGARVQGEVRIHPRMSRRDHHLSFYKRPGFYLAQLLMFAAAFAFGLLLYALLPGLFDVGLRTSREFFRALGTGFVLLVVPPLAIAAIALTVVGIPAAVLSLFVYIVAVYTAELLVSVWIGRTIVQHEAGILSFGRTLFLGLALLTVAGHVPFVGPPVTAVSVLLGLGLMWGRARRLPVLAGHAD